MDVNEETQPLFPRQRGSAGATVPSSGQSLNTGAIVGIVIGSVAGAAAIGFVVWTYIHRKRRERAGPQPRKNRREKSEDPLWSY